MRYHNGRLMTLKIEETPFLKFGAKTEVARACDRFFQSRGLRADPFNGYDKEPRDRQTVLETQPE